ncbi:MAG: hypothetical protein ABIQ35_03210 [Verrucomicrobiota bacterium]
MPTKRQNFTYVVVAAISGIIWFGIALVLDSGWAIPTKQILPFIGAMLCACLTGLFVSLLIYKPSRQTSHVIFICLTFATLPLAVLVFALLLWMMRRLLGIEFQPAVSTSHELELIVSTYLLGGLLSIFTPFLLILSIANNYLMRFLVQRQIKESVPRPT